VTLYDKKSVLGYILMDIIVGIDYIMYFMQTTIVDICYMTYFLQTIIVSTGYIIYCKSENDGTY
jgi:hypothetical protein